MLHYRQRKVGVENVIHLRRGEEKSVFIVSCVHSEVFGCYWCLRFYFQLILWILKRQGSLFAISLLVVMGHVRSTDQITCVSSALVGELHNWFSYCNARTIISLNARLPDVDVGWTEKLKKHQDGLGRISCRRGDPAEENPLCFIVRGGSTPLF